MKIIRVTRQQLHEIDNRLRPESRRVIKELTISNLYLQMENVLLVAEDDVEFFNFPKDENISIAQVVWKSARHAEPDIGGFAETVAHPSQNRHVFVSRPEIIECGVCGRGKEEVIHF